MAKAKSNEKKYHQYPCPVDIWQRLIIKAADQSKRERATITPGKCLEALLREKLNLKTD